ncbi:MAG: FG-GAP repeat protein [Nitrosomonas sp.]|nr:FG-GAP repeat protein [Nitrosomonas sp.]MBP6074851.1 FG-GAP repeat protein [Nitrosomonas sp.]
MAVPIFSVSDLNGSNGFRLDRTGASGSSISNAGDINGDGFDDVIVGAPGADPNGPSSGSSYVVFGKSAGFSAAMNLSNLDGNNGFRLDGVVADDRSGRSISNAGDVNGDGFDDLIIGAIGTDSNGNFSGSSYVVFGKTSGFSAAMNLSNLDGSNGFRLDGAAVYDFSGSSVSSAGDINGDGFDDLIIGAIGTDSNGNFSGSSYVVFGKASGFSAAMNLSNLDGNNGFRLDGAPNFSTSSTVSGAGDINGDGFFDVIIGGASSSYVVFGKASGFDATLDLSTLNGSNGFYLDVREQNISVSNAGDINGDGLDDLIVGSVVGYGYGYGGYAYFSSSYVVFGKTSGFSATLDVSSLDGSNGFLLRGPGTGSYGSPSVSNAGDVNGDGFDDVIVGAANQSYVVFGKDSGFSAVLVLSSLDGINGFRLTGGGSTVSSAGDVNGDGFDDLLVCNEQANSSFVVFGGDFIGTSLLPGTVGDDNLTGTSAAERFEADDGNDRMNGLGGSDVFHGGDGNDTIIVPDLHFQRIDGGTGTDTLELAGDNINLNLADFHDTIKGIETIVLKGPSSSDSTLTLSALDLLNLSDSSNTLTIDGNKGDRIFGLAEGWADGGVEGNYHIYTNQGAVLRVDTDMSTDRPTLGVFSLADLDGGNGFRLDGEGHSGWSVSNAGDVNGDGFDDLIIGAFFADLNGNFSGSSYVVFGQAAGFSAALNLSSLDGNNGFRLDGAATYDRSGISVSDAGDVNGDGFADVIVGAAGPNGNYSGSSYVVFGKASSFDATIDLSILDGSNGFRLDGVAELDQLGTSVSSAGDVNGDGFGDVIVGAKGADPNGLSSGSSYVVFGKAAGFNAALNLSSLDGNNGFRLDGVAADDASGGSVSNAGDVNGDGFNDLLIGASQADPNGSRSGSSYVVFGKASGFGATLDLSSLDGTNGFRLDGEENHDFSGSSVSSAGDINGDGFADLIVGAPAADPNGFGSGSSYVVFGKATGFSATINLSILDGSNGFRLDGVAVGDFSGRSVSSAGDVNGDGFDDLIVGAHRASPNGSHSGSSYVVFGKAAGFSATTNLSSLDGNSGFRLDGEKELDYSGTSVSGAGDVNGDGFDDLIIGADGADNPSGNHTPSGFGSSYVIFGRSDFGGSNVIAGTPDDDNLTGTSAAERFEAGDGNDRMIGHGGADVFHGGAGNDRIRVSDLSFQLADGGSGNSDVLSLGGGGNLNLDLADARGKISGIEIIYLHGGSGDKTLTLNATDVLNLSDTSNTLKVNGNEGDRVILQGDWADGGIQGGFHTYTSDAATSPEAAVLLVGINLTADFA